MSFLQEEIKPEVAQASWSDSIYNSESSSLQLCWFSVSFHYNGNLINYLHGNVMLYASGKVIIALWSPLLL